ncbi:unnamed protein product [Urochloa humidicola]
MENDVWDAQEWDGLESGHHPDLFEPLMPSSFVNRRRLLLRLRLRGSVLR